LCRYARNDCTGLKYQQINHTQRDRPSSGNRPSGKDPTLRLSPRHRAKITLRNGALIFEKTWPARMTEHRAGVGTDGVERDWLSGPTTKAAAISATATASITATTMKTWTRHEHLIWFAVFVVALIALAAIAFGSATLL
jgi:hypothetical protein